MAARAKKTLGIGAKCSVAKNYLHPKKDITDRYPNYQKGDMLDGLVAVKTETYYISGVPKKVIVFRHDDFPNKEVFCIPHWVKVREAAREAFEAEAAPPQPPAAEADRGIERPVPVVRNPDSLREDIEAVREAGLGVDDDNEPIPDNQPSATDPKVTNNWGWSGVCPRKSNGTPNTQPKLKLVADHLVSGLTYVTMFIMFIPKLYIENVVIPETNKKIGAKERHLNLGLFLRYIGIWLAMSTTAGYKKSEFWSMSSVDFFDGAPVRFHDIMSQRRFDEITRCLTFTAKPPPAFQDKFHWVRDLIKAFNDNMILVFVCGFVVCLDESMSIWTNRWTCPGWMFVPRKPHPMGNEWHTICCALCGIMFAIELVEGSDAPAQIVPLFAEFGPTPGLLLRLCESLFATGKIVILDSGFQVLKALVELKNRGVYASAVIKKRKTWPKFVDGDAMDSHMLGKNVGESDCLNGTLDNVPFFLFAMQDVDFCMKLMSTYGALLPPAKAEERQRKLKNGTKVRFRHTEPFYNHFKFRHAVDDHNNLRQGTLSLEVTWVTQEWKLRVFAFIIAVCEVNSFLAFRFFVWSEKERMTLLRYRRKLCKALIYNEMIPNDDDNDNTSPPSRKRRSKPESPSAMHQIATAPPHGRKYTNGKWDCSAKARYPQFVCKWPGCSTPIRTYCRCSPGEWLCSVHHSEHLVEVATSSMSLH